MAQIRLDMRSPSSLILCACLLACSTGADAPATQSELVVRKAEPTPQWHGLPMVPGLPKAFDSMTFGADAFQVESLSADALTPKGMRLSAESSARVVLSKSNTIRYLVVSLQVPATALLKQWPNSEQGSVDFRTERAVWVLPKQGIQIHLKSTEAGCELTYIPLTSQTMLVGPPTGTGLTFASYIGKPVASIVPLFTRLSEPKPDGSRFGWANPLRFETVSLKASLKLAPNGEDIASIDLFLKDRLTGELRAALEAGASAHWTGRPSQRGYTHTGVLMKISQTPQLGLRKRAHKNLTLSFSTVVEAALPKSVAPSTSSEMQSEAPKPAK